MISGGLVPQVQNESILEQPQLYIWGLWISNGAPTPNAFVAISPGQCRDSNNVMDLIVGNPTVPLNYNYSSNPGNPNPILLNSAINGFNGLDYGTVAANTPYNIYVIGDSRGYNPTGGLISLNSNAYPLLPLGYDSYRLVGFAPTNGSSLFSTVAMLHVFHMRSYYFNSPVVVLSGGNATTFTLINLNTALNNYPFNIAVLSVTFIPAFAGDTVQFRPGGSVATTGLVTIVGLQTGIPQTQIVQVMSGIVTAQAQIQYEVTNAGDSVSVGVIGNIFTLL